METARLTCFTKSKWHQNEENQQTMTLEMAWRTRPLQLALSGGPVTPCPDNRIQWDYNGLRGENRGPFRGQQASVSNPVMLWPKSNLFWYWSEHRPHSRQVTGARCTEVAARQSWAEYTSRVYSLGMVSRYSTVRSGTLTWREWGLWVRIHQHAIPPLCFQETPNLTCFKVKMASKWGISTDRDQNVICSEDGQNTPKCQIRGHSSLVLSRKYPKIANLACFTKSKCRPAKWGKSTDDDQNLISSQGGQNKSACVKFQAIQGDCRKTSGEESSLFWCHHKH